MSSSTIRAKEFVSQLQHVEKLIGQNHLPDAARKLNTLAKTAPNDPRLFLLGSLMADAAKNPSGALTAAVKAVELAPGWPVATLRLAAVYAAQGLNSQALQTAQQSVSEATQLNSLSPDYLIRAASIAVRCQNFLLATQLAEHACTLEPDNPALQHTLAQAMAYNRQFDKAIAVYSRLLEQSPNNATLLFDRLLAYQNTDELRLAQEDANRLLSIEPDNTTYLYYASILKGETPATQPPELVAQTFNAMALSFDRHLVGTLKYTLPREVAEMIVGWYPDKKLDLLDLGCGTGLLGACLGPVNGVIVGVDLSSDMIDQAIRHNVYAQFNQVNVLDALHATPSEHYDVITALDVFVYVGDLNPVIPNAHRILTPGGRFVFSCESAPEGVMHYALQATKRYVHQESHVLQLLTQAGFTDIQVQTTTLRMEAGQPVPAFVISARK